jgi:hypothetical protein
MADPYAIKNSRGDVIATIKQGTTNTSTSLVLYGRGTPEYGLDRNQSLIFLLENFANSTAPVNPLDGQLWWDTSVNEMFVWNTGSPETGSWNTVVPAPNTLGFIVEAGAGLTGGGFPTLSPASTTLNVGVGTGIQIGSPNTTIRTKDDEIDHDSLSNYVANEHVDHSAITIEAGAGLTGSPNILLPPGITLNVGAGDGINVNSGSPFGSPSFAAVDSTVVRTFGEQTIAGVKTFNDQIRGHTNNTPGNPAFGFGSPPGTGIYLSATNQISFSTSSLERFRIRSNGVLRSQTTGYESLVTEDEDIPNKAYVDGAAIGSPIPTSQTFVGANTITGLDSTQTYLVSVYGTIPSNKGRGSASLDSIRVRTGTTPGAGILQASTPLFTINWPDGKAPTFAQFIIDASLSGGFTSINATTDEVFAPNSPQILGNMVALAMTAVQITNN